jgi:starch synthase
MKILYITTEVKPFSKVGGIGDVAGELPPALKKQGVDIEIVTPWYGSIRLEEYPIEYQGGIGNDIGIGTSKLREVPIHFIKDPTWFEGQFSEPYTHSTRAPFFDDALRFSNFSKNCLKIIEQKNPDIVHINDWGLAYLFAFMKMENMSQKRVITVHNIGNQGNLGRAYIKGTEMETIHQQDEIGPLFDDPRPKWKSVNALRLGLELCQMANTVSPTYALEITLPEDPGRYFEGGKGLEKTTKRLYQEGRLKGILNGYEYKFPATRLNYEKTLKEKRASRRNLNTEFINQNAFLLGFVGRAVEQKFKLLTEPLDGKTVLEHILDMPGINVAILTTGLTKYERFLKRFQKRNNFSVTIAFDTQKAKEISLGSDVFLMPSIFEPCGITQMASMSYATPPLVRWTGGLVDTVKPYSEPDGTGFGFDGDTGEEVLRNLILSIREAQNLYMKDRRAFEQLQRQAYNQRFLWETAAKKYIKEVYEPLLMLP